MAKLVIAALAMAVAMTTASARAQDTHTLTPHYPDHFKIEGTRVNESEKFSQGKHVTTRTKTVFTEAAQKTDTGYKATVTDIKVDFDSQNADGTPAAGMAQQKGLIEALTVIAPAEITMDRNMAPVSVDNIEAIKSRLKQALAHSGDTKVDAIGVQFYDAFISNVTPVTAAAFLKQMRAGNVDSIYNLPLTLHAPIALPDNPVQLMGANLHLAGTATLDDWVEGKSATITTVFKPSEADLHNFMTVFVRNMMSRLATSDNSQVQAMVDRLLDNMHMSMIMTCRQTVDLDNYVAGHADCTTHTDITLDIAKGMPPELVKQKPEVAKMPPMTIIQNDHSVADVRLLP